MSLTFTRRFTRHCRTRALFDKLPNVRHKRRMFFISVYGVTSNEDYIILKVTQATTVQEVIQQAVTKSNKADKPAEDYILVEEVQEGWEQREIDRGQCVQRILAPAEKVLQATNKWKGQGRFILRRATNDPSTRAWITTMVKEQKRREGSDSSDILGEEWDANDEMYFLCVHNVSEDQPYTVLQAPRSSTAQDIITQAIMKARRSENPQYYVLVDEALVTSDEKAGHSKTSQRVLANEENVYQVQLRHASSSLSNKLILMPRSNVPTVEEKKKEKGSLQKFSFMRFPLLGRDKRQRLIDRTSGVSGTQPRPSSYPGRVEPSGTPVHPRVGRGMVQSMDSPSSSGKTTARDRQGQGGRVSGGAGGVSVLPLPPRVKKRLAKGKSTD